jgi:hypothetical protein
LNRKTLAILSASYLLAGCQSTAQTPQNEKPRSFVFSEFAKITGTCYAETHKSVYVSHAIAAGMKNNQDLLFNLNNAYDIHSERNSDVVNWISKRDNSSPQSRFYIYRDAPLHCTESFLNKTNSQEVEMAKSCVLYANLPWMMSALKSRGATRQDFSPFAMYKAPINKYQAAYMAAYNKAMNALNSDSGEKYNPEEQSRLMLAECSLWILRASKK